VDPSFDFGERVERTDEGFRVDVDGFEGPLDLLLELARRQKVDLHKISVLALAEQYLAFIEAARGLRLELAADYLVMAAWLAYLKSRLLLPEAPSADEPEAADLAAALAERLRRLEAIRAAAAQLANRPQLGRDLFQRGAPEGVEGVTAAPVWGGTLYDLLAAYARQREKKVLSRVTLHKRLVWSLAEARDLLGRIVGQAVEWTVLDSYLIDYCVSPEARRTVRASTFSATLEMVREGVMAVRQDEAFAPLWIKNRPHPAPVALVPGAAGGQGG
jgi:segregation and condensation protein A